MQAIILAAGMGRRLGKVTADNTKCMVKIHGRTLIERMLDTLAKTEVNRVILVVGYKSENVKKLVGHKYKGMKILYVRNEVYDKTNNIHSLFLAKKYLLEDALTEPMVSVIANDNWVEYTLRYVVSYKKRRVTKTELFTRILKEIESTVGEIKFASATFHLVEAPELNVKLNQNTKE